MAEKKKFYIRVPEALVEVSEDVYRAYYKEKRHDRTVDEKNQRNGTFSYDELDTEDLTGEELISDHDATSVEDTALNKMLFEQLHRCLASLSKSEQDMLRSLYFDGLSERQLAQALGVHYMTIHSRKVAALRKLKKLIKF